MLRKFLNLFIALIFLSSLGPVPQAQAQPLLGLPEPGTMVDLSPAYKPVLIKGLTVHKDNPFRFDFIVGVGQDRLAGENLKKESEKLIKYFLASLALPEKDVWVNLSPYEKDRTIPKALSQTEMGRDLLAQDYLLKQITASLIYPEKELGRAFWDRVYSKARQQFGSAHVPVNTFNKVWIMADKASVFERNQTAFVVDSHLKVMLEEDYLAIQKNRRLPGDTLRDKCPQAGCQAAQPLNTKATQGNNLSTTILKDIILPELEREVNTGKHFANLRQIFNSIILASWYKNNLKETILNQVYADKAKVKGVDLKDPTVKEQIYQRYLQAYKKGVFNYIKEDVYAAGQPRKYFSGGINPAMAAHPDRASVADLNRQTRWIAQDDSVKVEVEATPFPVAANRAMISNAVMTGATGFLGEEFVKALQRQEEASALVLNERESRALHRLSSQMHQVVGTLVNVQQVKNLFQGKEAGAVINLAADTRTVITKEDIREVVRIFETNILGPAVVLLAAQEQAPASRKIFISSFDVTQFPIKEPEARQWLEEQSEAVGQYALDYYSGKASQNPGKFFEPIALYARDHFDLAPYRLSKVLMEAVLRKISKDKRIEEVIVLRIMGPIGTGMVRSQAFGLLMRVVNAVKAAKEGRHWQGGPVPVFRGWDTSWIPVETVIDVLRDLATVKLSAGQQGTPLFLELAGPRISLERMVDIVVNTAMGPGLSPQQLREHVLIREPGPNSKNIDVEADLRPLQRILKKKIEITHADLERAIARIAQASFSVDSSEPAPRRIVEILDRIRQFFPEYFRQVEPEARERNQRILEIADHYLNGLRFARAMELLGSWSEADRRLAEQVMIQARRLLEQDTLPDAFETIVTTAKPVVLAIDDDSVERSRLWDLLTRAGYFVLDAGNVQQALHHLRRYTHIKMVLSDWHMSPDVSGVEFLRLINVDSQIKTKPPVMIRSGLVADGMKEFQSAFGDEAPANFKGWVDKAVGPSVLLSRVQEVLPLDEAMRATDIAGSKLSVSDLENVRDKIVMVREGYDITLENGKLADENDIRITESFPTIEELSRKGAKVVLIAHLKRPNGPDPTFSLAPVAARLKVQFGDRLKDFKTNRHTMADSGDFVRNEMKPGDIVLFENLRFDPREEKNDQKFADELYKGVDVYVNDAPSAMHRAHASIVGAPKGIPRAMGLLTQKEVEVLNQARQADVGVLGGSKVADKINVIKALLDGNVDQILVGGAMANAFLKAEGKNVGASVGADDINVALAKQLLHDYPGRITFPVDLIVVDDLENPRSFRQVSAEQGASGKEAIVDIGPATALQYADLISAADTVSVFWNGPMGAYDLEGMTEKANYGTQIVGKAVALAGKRAVIGGGDTWIAYTKLVDKMDRQDSEVGIATGGGASLEYLEGKKLPGIEALSSTLLRNSGSYSAAMVADNEFEPDLVVDATDVTIKQVREEFNLPKNKTAAIRWYLKGLENERDFRALMRDVPKEKIDRLVERLNIEKAASAAMVVTSGTVRIRRHDSNTPYEMTLDTFSKAFKIVRDAILAAQHDGQEKQNDHPIIQPKFNGVDPEVKRAVYIFMEQMFGETIPPLGIDRWRSRASDEKGVDVLVSRVNNWQRRLQEQRKDVGSAEIDWPGVKINGHPYSQETAVKALETIIRLTGARQLKGKAFVASYAPRGADVLADAVKDIMEEIKAQNVRELQFETLLGPGLVQYVMNPNSQVIAVFKGVLQSEIREIKRQTKLEADDFAQLAGPGGIDLNTKNVDWTVAKQGTGVEMAVDPAMLERIRRDGIEGLTPVILRMTPIPSIWSYLK